ncbi:FAD-binding PCMH-type domain-containing protein [Mycena chlorophos]|uniref:FAD-binding PCMH-type domain-containing protein n=1 Tax=Mycena chlorophos TaxID=658473 RepID=A0A8H6SMC0_MYCCL|nr:FAD-binding PCMH-type domain-containing protein [Mycena chlorophos]
MVSTHTPPLCKRDVDAAAPRYSRTPLGKLNFSVVRSQPTPRSRRRAPNQRAGQPASQTRLEFEKRIVYDNNCADEDEYPLDLNLQLLPELHYREVEASSSFCRSALLLNSDASPTFETSNPANFSRSPGPSHTEVSLQTRRDPARSRADDVLPDITNSSQVARPPRSSIGRSRVAGEDIRAEANGDDNVNTVPSLKRKTSPSHSASARPAKRRVNPEDIIFGGSGLCASQKALLPSPLTVVDTRNHAYPVDATSAPSQLGESMKRQRALRSTLSVSVTAILDFAQRRLGLKSWPAPNAIAKQYPERKGHRRRAGPSLSPRTGGTVSQFPIPSNVGPKHLQIVHNLLNKRAKAGNPPVFQFVVGKNLPKVELWCRNLLDFVLGMHSLLKYGVTTEIPLFGLLQGVLVLARCDVLRLRRSDAASVRVHEQKTHRTWTVGDDSLQNADRLQVMLYGSILHQHLSGQLDLHSFLRETIGLDPYSTIDVTIRWRSGKTRQLVLIQELAEFCDTQLAPARKQLSVSPRLQVTHRLQSAYLHQQVRAYTATPTETQALSPSPGVIAVTAFDWRVDWVDVVLSAWIGKGSLEVVQD